MHRVRHWEKALGSSSRAVSPSLVATPITSGLPTRLGVLKSFHTSTNGKDFTIRTFLGFEAPAVLLDENNTPFDVAVGLTCKRPFTSTKIRGVFYPWICNH